MRQDRIHKAGQAAVIFALLSAGSCTSLDNPDARSGGTAKQSSLAAQAGAMKTACYFRNIDDYADNAGRCIAAYAAVSNTLEDLAEQGVASGSLPKRTIREAVRAANTLVKYEPAQSAQSAISVRSSIIAITDLAIEPVQLDPHYRSPIWSLAPSN